MRKSGRRRGRRHNDSLIVRVQQKKSEIASVGDRPEDAIAVEKKRVCKNGGGNYAGRVHEGTGIRGVSILF